MAKKFETKPIESIISDLVQGVLDVNELNLAKANQRSAFLKAVAERPALLTKISKSNEESFLALAIKENPNYFVQLKKEQYTNSLAQIYLYERLKDQKGAERVTTTIGADMLVRKSFDDKITFSYTYVTPDGEELYYMDKELSVPVSLKSNIVITLKLEDAVALISKLDTHITQLGEQKIKSVISNLVSNKFKSYLNQYIIGNNIGYYTLCTSFDSIESGFVSSVSESFKQYGISISEFVVKNIAIPKDIQFKLEDQAIKIRQRRTEIEADVEFSKLSLESYEAKLKLHNSFPNAEVTLTEYEKDLALKRYLTKIGKKNEENVDRTIRMEKKLLRADSTVEKKNDIIPDIPVKINGFRIAFIFATIIALVVSIIVLANSAGAGFLVLAALTLILGLVATFNTKKFANEVIEPSVDSEVDNLKAPKDVFAAESGENAEV